MTAGYLAAKVHGNCVRVGCTSPACETSVLCRPHADAAAARVRRSTTRSRSLRRAAGQCVDCGRPCDRYRCLGGCGPRQLQLVPYVG